jgi:hypothetical protein
MNDFNYKNRKFLYHQFLKRGSRNCELFLISEERGPAILLTLGKESTPFPPKIKFTIAVAFTSKLTSPAEVEQIKIVTTEHELIKRLMSREEAIDRFPEFFI